MRSPRSLEDALRRGGIPYRVVGGVSFYQRREIKDALAYLRLLVNPNDLASLRRVINLPVRGIGAKTQGTLWSYAAAHQIGAWEGLERVKETGLTARAVNARFCLQGSSEQIQGISCNGLCCRHLHVR